MSGPGYHPRDVPYVMFFMGIMVARHHWHNNFGVPMSCAYKLTIDDAPKLFSWASVARWSMHY
jgi:hypothetical protein